MAAAGDVTWQWLNLRGGWQDFNAPALRQLEAACRSGRRDCHVDSPAGRLSVNLQSMLQKQLSGSSAPRRVRRLVDGQEQPPVIQPAVQPSLTQAQAEEIGRRLSRKGALASDESQDETPLRAAVAKAKAAAARPPRPTRGGSPGTHRGGTSSPSEASAPRSSRQGSPSRKTASGRGSGSSAVRRLRSSSPAPGNFEDDEAFAMWLSSQENLSDETIARLYSEHVASRQGSARSRRPPAPATRRGDALNIDNMSYEELLALSDRVGYVERKRPTVAAMASIPTRLASSDDVEEEAECAVCCECYVEGDELRVLPCFHEFHKFCIDKWFCSGHASARKCPMCNADVGCL